MVDVNELPAEGTHFFGVCVPHLRTGTQRFLRTLCVPLVRTLRGTQKGTQKNPASVDLERLPDFSVVTVGLEPTTPSM